MNCHNSLGGGGGSSVDGRVQLTPPSNAKKDVSAVSTHSAWATKAGASELMEVSSTVALVQDEDRSIEYVLLSV